MEVMRIQQSLCVDNVGLHETLVNTDYTVVYIPPQKLQ